MLNFFPFGIVQFSGFPPPFPARVINAPDFTFTIPSKFPEFIQTSLLLVMIRKKTDKSIIRFFVLANQLSKIYMNHQNSFL